VGEKKDRSDARDRKKLLSAALKAAEGGVPRKKKKKRWLEVFREPKRGPRKLNIPLEENCLKEKGKQGQFLPGEQEKPNQLKRKPAETVWRKL